MTAMDVTFRYPAALTAEQIQALARVPDVYGIRKLDVDEAARTIAVEYDATRLTAAKVEALLRRCGIAAEPAVALA